MLTFAQSVAADSTMIFAAEFSETVAFLNGVQSVSVPALVDMTYQEVDMDGGTVIQSTKPRLSLWAPLVPWALMAQQIVIIRGARYVIRDVDAQGDLNAAGNAGGSVIVILNRAGRSTAAPAAPVCPPGRDRTEVMLGVTGAHFHTDSFAVAGTVYALTWAPDGELIMVHFDGVLQPATEYAIAGSTLTVSGDVVGVNLTITAVYSY